MIINGNNVGVIISDILPLPANISNLNSVKLALKHRLGKLKLRKLFKFRSMKSPYKDLLLAYFKNDADNFFFNFANIIKERIVKVLQKRTEFITSKNFTIYVYWMMSLTSETLMQYDADNSTADRVYLRINTSPELIKQVIEYNEKAIDSLIYQEFIHHLDRLRIRKGLSIKGKSKLSEGLSYYEYQNRDMKSSLKLPTNLDFIYYIFNGVRSEGITTFYEKINHNRFIYFYTQYFKMLITYLHGIATDFSKPSVNMYKEIDFLSKRFYSIGAMMVAIINIHYLLEHGFKFSVWIEPEGFVWFGKKSYNADSIKDFFGKKDFNLNFTDRKIDNILFENLKLLTQLNHNQFLERYEKACKYFQIEETFLNSKSYYYYATLCIYEYRKQILGIEDKKVLRKLQEFKK